VAVSDPELAEPAADASHVCGRAGQLVPAECFLQVVDGLLPVALPDVQDAEVFRGGGLGPRVMMLRGGLGQAGQVLTSKAQAVSRGGGDGGESRIASGERFGGTGGEVGQLLVTRGQCGADQPG
jgi:hypothetical protein